jgi:tRNA threonylcarbamoyl adenosine modification protein YeaZ
MELAIDTSSSITGIAVSNRGELLASLTWQTARNHTTELLPNLVCLLQQVKVKLTSVDAIIVAKGPGSFNGLRVGIGTAKGLSSALDIPLLGLNTLEIEAHPFAFTGLPLRPIHRAGREEIATALYRQKDSEWKCLEQENLTTVKTLHHRIKQKTLFCGEIPQDVVHEIQLNLGRQAVIARSDGLCRVNSLIILGWQKLNRGERDDPVTLQPLYLRPPHITQPRDRAPSLLTRVRGKSAKKWKCPN